MQALGVGKTMMTYALTIDQKDTHLDAIVTGRNSRENVTRYLDDIIRECEARHGRRLLIEERFEGPRLGTVDIFQIVAAASERFSLRFEAIAYVDVNARDDSMKFAEDTAVNRGIPVTVFPSVAEAQKWLQGGCDDKDESC
jgi:hypothetical protein